MRREIKSEISGSSTNHKFNVKVERVKWGDDEINWTLMISNNGFQWSGANVDTLEQVALVIQALGQVLIDEGITPGAIMGVEMEQDLPGPKDALRWVVSGGDRCPGCGEILHLYVDPFEDQHVMAEWCPVCGYQDTDLSEGLEWIMGLAHRGDNKNG